MFVRKLSVQRVDADGERHPCPLQWIDSFAMRNFTNDAIFDDTLPARTVCLKRGIACRSRPFAAGDGRLVSQKGLPQEGRAA